MGDPTDPDGLYVWMQRYLSWLRVRGYSERTIEDRSRTLSIFIEWLGARSVTRPVEVTRPILERYQRHLFHHRQAKNGRPLAFRTQSVMLVPVRALFKWLTKQNVLLANPASEIELPRLDQRLPGNVLTVAEAEAVLMQPKLTTIQGLRDRAILETFYSTAIRRAELLHLEVFDLDVERGTLMIRIGKGRKDRMVPIGERAIRWIDKYLRDARPKLLVDPDERTLFITKLGLPLVEHYMSAIVREYVRDADIGKKGSCHMLRHTAATLMLEGGADIRYIQMMLGHADLSSTEVYTHVSIRQLKDVHTRTHPAAQLVPKPSAVAAAKTNEEARKALLEALGDDGEDEDGEPAPLIGS